MGTGGAAALGPEQWSRTAEQGYVGRGNFRAESGGGQGAQRWRRAKEQRRWAKRVVAVGRRAATGGKASSDDPMYNGDGRSAKEEGRGWGVFSVGAGRISNSDFVPVSDSSSLQFRFIRSEDNLHFSTWISENMKKLDKDLVCKKSSSLEQYNHSTQVSSVMEEAAVFLVAWRNVHKAGIPLNWQKLLGSE
nr:hypothetical protein Iba_chr07aCG9610 [Ipomoea batatas]